MRVISPEPLRLDDEILDLAEECGEKRVARTLSSNRNNSDNLGIIKLNVLKWFLQDVQDYIDWTSEEFDM